jgi:hypothetical protein
MTHITPYLAMVLAGFAVFVGGLAWGQVQTARARRPRR